MQYLTYVNNKFHNFTVKKKEFLVAMKLYKLVIVRALYLENKKISNLYQHAKIPPCMVLPCYYYFRMCNCKIELVTF